MDSFHTDPSARKDAGSPAPEEEAPTVPTVTIATPSNPNEEASKTESRHFSRDFLTTPASVPGPRSESSTGDHLSHFRYHLGIHQHQDLIAKDNRAAPNLGVYQRVVKAENNSKKQFHMYNWMINGALCLQIVFAAALTALGAGNGPRSAVTAFGAMNTILAGLLTFLKGSGLPNRLKYYQNEWGKVREYIEQRERDFIAPRTNETALGMDLNKEIAVIEHMYETVRRDVEANQPDSYVSLRNTIGGGGSNEAVTTLSRARDRLSNITDTAKGYEARASHLDDRARAKFDDYNKEAGVRISEMERDVEKGLYDTRYTAESRLRDESRAAENRIGEKSQQAEGKAREMEDKVMLAAEKAAERVLQLTKHRHT